MKEHTIIGMAGHIDHGKTALIRALSGIETDQLKEEQERGITIDIGFAYWKDNVTIIDVPGHEKFIRNMVAGVSTVDLFLLVIAADDGIMPQTREHLDILKFFGVRDGLVAINKTDLVDSEWRELVHEEVQDFLETNGFTNIPVVEVSAVREEGIEQLKEVLDQKIAGREHKTFDRPFRLNVDRSFSAKGFGSIVTGTVLSSEISVGDSIQSLPGNLDARVRGLQVHQHPVERAVAGQRVAMNISGITKDKLPRGTVLVEPQTLSGSDEFIADIFTTANFSFKIKRFSEVRVHLGTSEILGRLTWFDEDSWLQNGKNYTVRIKLSETAVAAPGDAVLLRSISPVTTIAGGKVLQINAARLKLTGSDLAEYIKILGEGKLADRIRLHFQYAGFQSVTVREIQNLFFEQRQTVQSILDKLKRQKVLIDFEFRNETHFLDAKNAGAAIDIIEQAVADALKKEQFKKGLNFKELENILQGYRIGEGFLERVLQMAIKRERLFFDGSVYFNHDMLKSNALSQIQNDIAAYYLDSRFNAPDLQQLAAKFEIDPKSVKNITYDLAKEGVLKSIGGQYYLHHQCFDELQKFLRSFFEKETELGIATVRDYTASTRKYIIPLMEYLDNAGFTLRRDDIRFKGPKL